MRIDKFLNSVNLTKRRAVAQDMLQNGVVSLNDKIAKQSKEVAVGDALTITYLNGEKKYRILEVPTTKSTPKSDQDRYIEEIH
jgi:ribosome-associated heat shock protein Hsp15